MTTFEKATELLLQTDLTTTAIRKQLQCRGQVVSDALKTLGSEFASERKRKMYRKSRLGTKNPMYGKRGVHNPNFIGLVDDCKGYWLITKPAWYTGRKRSKHIFYHHYVYCLEENLTEIRAGYTVHHCDLNKRNNDFSNLMLMTLAEHAALHSRLKGATTISKESTAKWLEARRKKQ